MIYRIASLAVLLLLAISAALYADVASDAEQMIEKRRFDAAIEILQREIQEDPGYAELYYLAGRAYYEKGDYEQAADYLEKCLDRKRKHSDALYYRALVHIANEEWEEARDIIGDRPEKEKDEKEKAMFYNALALYHQAREEFDDADYNFRMALVYDEESSEYQRNLADLSYEQGYYGSASQQYQDIVAEDSTDILAWFKLGKSNSSRA
jgi:tetratricopeptide (TPR) repeat protein